jgi:hypothetical protein
MATAADFQALAARIGPEQVAISSVVASCAALEGGQLVDWYALAKRCVVYVGTPSLAESGMRSWDALIAQGNDLWTELATWRATLEALGCAVPHLREVPAPPPKGRPGSGWSDLWGAGQTLPLLLIAVAWVVWKGDRRGL